MSTRKVTWSINGGFPSVYTVEVRSLRHRRYVSRQWFASGRIGDLLAVARTSRWIVRRLRGRKQVDALDNLFAGWRVWMQRREVAS